MNILKKHLPVSVAAVLMALTFASCSDDNGPAGVGLGGGGTPDGYASVSISADDWTVTESYSPADPIFGDPEQTTFTGKYDASSTTLKNVGPGDRVVISLRFADPLLLTRDAPGVSITQASAGGLVANFLDFQMTTRGNWPESCNPGGHLLGNNNGLLTSTRLGACFAPAVGNVLEQLTFEFTVPATFNIGNAISETPELPLTQVYWYVTYDGDHRGEDPPVVAR